jgi:hypothetical protein
LLEHEFRGSLVELRLLERDIILLGVPDTVLERPGLLSEEIGRQ